MAFLLKQALCMCEGVYEAQGEKAAESQATTFQPAQCLSSQETESRNTSYLATPTPMQLPSKTGGETSS